MLDQVLGVGLGLGLAAACGFRVFVPLLVMSAAAYTGHIDLGAGFEWIGSLPALLAFATATVVEVAAYYIPWVDHLLDSVSGPAAIVAGTVVTASSLTDVDPFLKWSLAIIGGGGLAGLVKGSTTIARGASTLSTAGLANPLLSTMELGTSFVLSALAVLLPLLALMTVVTIGFFVSRKLFRWLNRQEVQRDLT
jgi:hypothetical protein